MSEANRFRVEGHNPHYGDLQGLYPVEAKFKGMFGWQHKAFNDGKDERFFAVQAFCGSGKSILQINLAIHDIVSSGYTQKQLFSVPQGHIHKGFVGEGSAEYLSLIQNKVEYQWTIQPQHNFCEGEDVLSRLKKWLLTPPARLAKGFTGKTIGGLNAICTHAALTAVWVALNDEEKAQAIRHLTLRIDEAHHIKLVFLDNEETTAEERLAIQSEATELGRICTYFVNSRSRNCKLHLTTATMYRGDRSVLLSQAVREKFFCYNLDWIEHFRSLGIKSFYLQYEEYADSPIDQIVSRIQAEPQEKHFVVVPRMASKWRNNGDEYKVLLAKLEALGLRVLDLVTQRTQDKNKKLLLAEPKTNDPATPSMFDVVVTCNLGREGTDWCPCSRLHNASCENSITLAVQTIGRPFRRYAGKGIVQIYHYVKKFKMPKDSGVTKRELFVDRTNALLVCMQTNDMSNPILIVIIPKQGTKRTPKGNKPPVVTITLNEFLGDQYQSALVAALEGYEALDDDQKNSKGVFKMIGEVCDEFGIEEDDPNREDVQWALTLRIMKEANAELKQIAGIDVAFLRHAGFDKILSKYELNRSIYFGDFNEEDYQAVRNIIQGDWMTSFRELQKVGLDNIKPGHPLYRFVVQNVREFREFKNGPKAL